MVAAIERRRSEQGTGVIGSAAGVAVFLAFLLFAVQLAANLYATSTVTAAGFDAARAVAAAAPQADPAVARADAERTLRGLLGDTGRRAEITWQVSAEVVRLRIVVDAPAIVPTALGRTAGARRIDRTFEVRRERVR